MSKYSSHARQAPKAERGVIHPVMRGIGCVMMVIVPFLAYGISVLLVNYGAKHGWPIPPNWYGTPTFHPLLWRVTGFVPILNFLQAQTNLTANIIFAIAIAVVVFGIMSLVYGYVYTIFAPPRYGPTDAPPIRVKVKRYKR